MCNCAGVPIWFQAGLPDAGAPQGFGLSNALRATTP